MSTPRRCPAIDFDHNSQAHADDTVGSYRAIRTSTPIAWTEAHQGYWVLSDYASVFEAARDDETFSSRRTPYGGEGLAVVIPKTPMHLHIPIELDPPEFRTFRKIVNRVTAPAAVERMRAKIDHYTTWFIDQVIETGECDFTDVIGVPAIVTVDWLGLDAEDWKRYSTAHRATLSGVPGSPEFQQAVEVDLPELSERMQRTITARREAPADDIISYLVQQEIDGRPITDEEVFAMTELLVAGGTGTTASLVSQALVWLYRHPDVRQTLIDHPEKLERAVEEFLRYFSPTQALARTVVQDRDFRGCPMKTGDRVLLAWASANRDESVFENADEIDIERWPNRHTSFGVGVHRCVGSHLGRAMSHALISQLLERMPDYTIDLDALERYPQQGTNVGFRSIPARFTPGPRRLPADA
ncbi:cytochrome P450 [Spirillospora sp. NPDC048819]|uniref:cytochrome P450 n=1 Tax=Spirillospora sp. NPDC048819 TaxID=3155268 RepID=UPI0033CF3A49